MSAASLWILAESGNDTGLFITDVAFFAALDLLSTSTRPAAVW